FPMMWFFDMVRLWRQTARAYYVEIRNQAGQWVQVTSQENAAAQAWTIRRFTNNRLYAAREVRITFPGSAAVDLRELQCWTVTLADEILAEVLRLTGSMEILNADGSVKLDAQGLKVAMTDGHKIDLTKDGLTMTPAGFSHPGMILTGYALQFWDKDKIPSIGIGDVRDMAAQLGSDMEYGFLMNQGEIRASQAVLEASLTDTSVTKDKLAPGSVVGDVIPGGAIIENQIAPGAIGITSLGEQIHVPDVTNVSLLRYQNDSEVIVQLPQSTWTTVTSWTVPVVDSNKGMRMEIFVVKFEAKAGQGADVRFRINNDVFVTLFFTDTYQEFSFLVDARGFSGNVTFAIEAIAAYSNPSHRTVYIRNRRVYQNEQLPIRWGFPIYTVGEGPIGCYVGCEVSCQASCQLTCEGSCEKSCQHNCQRSCQTNCQ